MLAKKALIFGASGQDGSYLCRHLIGLEYEVHGTTRVHSDLVPNLERLGIRDQVKLHIVNPEDAEGVEGVFSHVEPDEAYMLSGLSSVRLSFERPTEALSSNTTALVNALEVIRTRELGTRLFFPSSSECFGTTASPADLDTPFQPCSPYGIAKAAGHFLIRLYRESYGLYACSGILFNHESPLRPVNFVTQKIISSAVKIADGKMDKLTLGNLETIRDWGWAPEFVEGIHTILQQPQPRDFIIATGESYSLEDFVDLVFQEVGLKWTDHVQSDPSLFRLTDIAKSEADTSETAKQLGWEATVKMPEIIKRLIVSEKTGRLD